MSEPEWPTSIYIFGRRDNPDGTVTLRCTLALDLPPGPVVVRDAVLTVLLRSCANLWGANCLWILARNTALEDLCARVHRGEAIVPHPDVIAVCPITIAVHREI